MAGQSPSYTAGGTIRNRRFVKITADFTVSEADANEKLVGVARPVSRRFDDANAALVGEPVAVAGEGEVVELEAGGTIAAGDWLKSDADGKAVVSAVVGTTVQFIGARALQGAASGEMFRAQVALFPYLPAVA